MKRLVFFLLLLALSHATKYNGVCNSDWPLTPRPHSVSVSEFGAVGDGKTLNTLAFQNAIFYLKSFADKGGAQLYVPAGKWLIGTINLTSHLTLFLEKDAIILGSQTESEVDAWAHPTFPFAVLLLSVLPKMATGTAPEAPLTVTLERKGE
ncbi:probable polygalacturonase [Olea europaea var. sylvestris]|uniref:probable polygalacturonase n=1 Tax=Olea europaea var. sylvestris TaxID=158386 RepID=UPI000C1CD6B0|nr:probable polygalacturonase [Olea europaea var. sylvestris]